jgi:anti-sigma B factor antagonist
MASSADRAEVGGLRVTAEAAEHAVVLRLDGELDLAGTPQLTAAVEAWLAGPTADRPLVADLSAVGFMDSTGVRGLVEVDRAVRAQNLPFALLNPSPPVLRVLDLVDLRRAFVEIRDLEMDTLARVGERGQA